MVRELHLLVMSKWPDFVFLIETMCGRKRVKEVKNKLGFDYSFVVESRGLSGGLVLLIGFYGSPKIAKRGDSWNLLKMIRPKEDKAWLCFGGFNEIMHHSEKFGAASRPCHQIEAFRTSVDCCGLSDLGFEGSKFTWCNNREGVQFTKKRLDRALGNLLWTNLFYDYSISALAAQTFNHCPLLINARSGGRRGLYEETKWENIFIFEASWNLHEDCSSIINSSLSHQEVQ
ncbi:hypothetical protein I3842_15G045300 [Carya illinoinensis]|uniref:Uncharacterized protein n=1 Tax=Carya illinoinensis TaxID=32201 RepID=A0A922A9E7_CARIL|nr:hypothetical protein I3842_15G045300 [Carya illinoinensis]